MKVYTLTPIGWLISVQPIAVQWLREEEVIIKMEFLWGKNKTFHKHPVCPYVCMSLCPYVCKYVCLYVCMSVYVYVFMSVCMCVRPSVCPIVSPSCVEHLSLSQL